MVLSSTDDLAGIWQPRTDAVRRLFAVQQEEAVPFFDAARVTDLRRAVLRLRRVHLDGRHLEENGQRQDDGDDDTDRDEDDDPHRLATALLPFQLLPVLPAEFFAGLGRSRFAPFRFSHCLPPRRGPSRGPSDSRRSVRSRRGWPWTVRWLRWCGSARGRSPETRWPRRGSLPSGPSVR